MPDPTATFEAHRDRLLDLAYGMLGRVSMAKDVVQDAYLRWQDVDPETVEDPGGYLSTIVTRLCLDELTSARAERETYTGPWLPEPVVETNSHQDSSGDSFRRPDASIERTGELSMALLVLLEQLRPIERAVYVLREAFGRPYAEIARIVDRTEAHCRKIAQRARTRIEVDEEPIDAPPEAHAQLLEPFVTAIQERDSETLARVLADDVTHYTDGGEIPEAAKRPIEGLERVTRFYFGIAPEPEDDVDIRPVWVNRRPGLLVVRDGSVYNVMAFRVRDGQIQEVYTVMNPEKLAHLSLEELAGGGTDS